VSRPLSQLIYIKYMSRSMDHIIYTLAQNIKLGYVSQNLKSNNKIKLFYCKRGGCTTTPNNFFFFFFFVNHIYNKEKDESYLIIFLLTSLVQPRASMNTILT
jgi:hypothetical protein